MNNAIFSSILYYTIAKSEKETIKLFRKKGATSKAKAITIDQLKGENNSSILDLDDELKKSFIKSTDKQTYWLDEEALKAYDHKQNKIFWIIIVILAAILIFTGLAGFLFNLLVLGLSFIVD